MLLPTFSVQVTSRIRLNTIPSPTAKNTADKIPTPPPELKDCVPCTSPGYALACSSALCIVTLTHQRSLKVLLSHLSFLTHLLFCFWTFFLGICTNYHPLRCYMCKLWTDIISSKKCAIFFKIYFALNYMMPPILINTWEFSWYVVSMCTKIISLKFSSTKLKG